MITISKIYNIKEEFKLLSSALRVLSKSSQEVREEKLTECIDAFVDRWKELEVSRDTFNKLYRYALVFRHNHTFYFIGFGL